MPKSFDDIINAAQDHMGYEGEEREAIDELIDAAIDLNVRLEKAELLISDLESRLENVESDI